MYLQLPSGSRSDHDYNYSQRPKTKLERVTALAHKHQRATFKPELYKALAPRPAPSNRRTRPSVIVDPETGEVTEPNKRKSQRTSTMLKRAATINKLLQDAEERVSFRYFTRSAVVD
jgi:hypothetical protein